MEPAQVGNIIGYFFGIILLPVIILIVCNFIPAAKRNPEIVYGVCGTLAVFLALLSAAGGANILNSTISAVLGALFFFFGYRRASKKRDTDA